MMVLQSLGEKATPFFAVGQMDQSHLFHMMNRSRVHKDPRENQHNISPAAIHSQVHLVMFLQEFEGENNL